MKHPVGEFGKGTDGISIQNTAEEFRSFGGGKSTDSDGGEEFGGGGYGGGEDCWVEY